ncbi:hypothetical protein [Mucilaginibacter sp.]|uniref:hypothetical protein n=1 Tax=Mucilaginibacter sp. TaxID=1882438 RepID=UPI00374D1D53
MKKIILSTGILFLTLASFAGTKSTNIINETKSKRNVAISSYSWLMEAVRMTATYVSSCGVTWNCVSHGATEGEAVSRMYSLTQSCDAACGTNTTLIVQ